MSGTSAHGLVLAEAFLAPCPTPSAARATPLREDPSVFSAPAGSFSLAAFSLAAFSSAAFSSAAFFSAAFFSVSFAAASSVLAVSSAVP